MALVTRTLSNVGAPLYAPDGTLLSNTTITFTLVDFNDQPTSAYDITTGERILGTTTVTTNANGEFTVALWPNDRGDKTTKYACIVKYTGADKIVSIVTSGITTMSWLEFKTAGSVVTPIILSALDIHIADPHAHGGIVTMADLIASNITVTARTIGNSTNLDIALQNLDESQYAETNTGFELWTGSGSYYSVAADGLGSFKLTLLRGGEGYIRGQKVIWTAPQTTASFTTHSAHWIYIDSTGTIQITTSLTDTIYTDSIALFEVHFNSIDYEVVIENHPVSHPAHTSIDMHKMFGTILLPPDGSPTIGSDLTQITTGTGTVITDREVKLVGSSIISDHGLDTILADSGGVAISLKFYYTDALGHWAEAATQPNFLMQYNNAGVMTALAASGAGSVGLFTIYAVKAEPNTGAPIFLAVPHTANFNNVSSAQTAISNGANAIATGTLFDALEPCQLGHVVVQNNASGGYIAYINIAKSTPRSAVSGGSATTAGLVSTATTTFNRILSATDSTVQQALETLDNVEVRPTRSQTTVASLAPVLGLFDREEILTAQVGALTIANPTGTPVEGQILKFRLYSAAGSTLTFGTSYTGTYVALPASLTATKTQLMMFEYNSASAKFELISSQTAL